MASYNESNPLLRAISLVKSAAKQSLSKECYSFMKKTYENRYRSAERDFNTVREITDFYAGKRIDTCSEGHNCTALMQHIRGVYDNCAFALRKLDTENTSNTWKRKYYTERMETAKSDMNTIKELEEKYFKK